MQVIYIGISRNKILALADRLESELYPETCNVLSYQEQSADGNNIVDKIHLELAPPGTSTDKPNMPGVSLDLADHEAHIDWAVAELISLANIYGALGTRP